MPAPTKNFARFKEAIEFLKYDSVSIFDVDRIKELIPKDTDYTSGDVQDAAIKHFFQDTFKPLVQDLEQRCRDGRGVYGDEFYTLLMEPRKAGGQAMLAIRQADEIAKQARDAVTPNPGNAGSSPPGYSGHFTQSPPPYKPITSQPLHIETEALIEIHFLLKYQHKFSPEEIVNTSQEVVNRARAQAGEAIQFSRAFEKLDTTLQIASDMVSSGQNLPQSIITGIEQTVQEGLNPPEATREVTRGYQPPASQRSGNFRS